MHINTGPARGDYRDRYRGFDRDHLVNVIALPHTRIIHAIQHDFTGPKARHLARPRYGVALGFDGFGRVTGLLIDL
jgi:hypothetical protein